MTVQTLHSIHDGPRITVDYLIGNPHFVPAKILDLLANGFITDTLLRDDGPNSEGVVGYNESTPLYLGSDVEDIAEFGEIPVGVGQLGLPRVAFSTRKGLGVRASKDMRDMNKIGAVNTQITQLVNTMVRAQERQLRRALLNPAIPSIAATVAWTDPASEVRHDLAQATEVIAAAQRPGSTAGDEGMGYQANTVVFPGSIVPTLMDNDKFLKVYDGTLADESILYTGKLPGQVLGLQPLTSRTWDSTRVLVVERGTVGFYSDQRALQSTGMYPEGNGPNGGPTESWRSDTTMRRVVGIDQPLAACWITGVRAS